MHGQSISAIAEIEIVSNPQVGKMPTWLPSPFEARSFAARTSG
jgi:hypothetical protein